jgi:hypothetical protein
MNLSIAPGTRASYETGVKRWKAYCRFRHWDPQGEITTAHAEEWLAAMADEGKVNVASMKAYRSALSAYHIERTPAAAATVLGKPVNPLGHPRIERLLAGIERDQAERRQTQRARVKEKTEGVTMDMILKLIERFKNGTDNELMNTAAASLGVATALRPSEILGSAKHRDRTLRVSQLQFFADPEGLHTMAPVPIPGSGVAAERQQANSSPEPDHCVLTLLISKTNQRRTAKPRYIGIPAVVGSLWRWACRRSHHDNATPIPPSNELFKRAGYKPLRTKSLLSFLTQHLPELGFPEMENLTGKTFRIGGASTLAALGAPAEDIRALGGWAPSSDMWKQYASAASQRQRALFTQRNLARQTETLTAQRSDKQH